MRRAGKDGFSALFYFFGNGMDCFLITDIIMTQPVAVFRGGAVGVFAKTAVKGSKVVKAGLEGNVRNGEGSVGGKHGLGCLNTLVAQIIVECGMGMLLKQPGKMVFGKTDMIRNLFQSKVFHVMDVNIVKETGKYFIIF